MTFYTPAGYTLVRRPPWSSTPHGGTQDVTDFAPDLG